MFYVIVWWTDDSDLNETTYRTYACSFPTFEEAHEFALQEAKRYLKDDYEYKIKICEDTGYLFFAGFDCKKERKEEEK